jgi:C-terminal processing protease CtpA/Prc
MAKGPIPARVVQTRHDVVKLDAQDGIPLNAFLAKVKKLSHDERALIVEQAIMLLASFHVNLPLKGAMYAVDPLRRLRLLQRRLTTLFDDDRRFHREMTQIFNSVNDIHTNYLLPEPFNSHSAWLPFTAEFCDDGGPTYLATKFRQPWPTDTDFREGVEILQWNGVPIARAVEIAGAQSPSGAGNIAARHAFGVFSLTLRPLSVLPPPDEEWVIVGYRTGRDKDKKEIQLRWLVSPNEGLDKSPPGGSIPTGSIRKLRKSLFATKDEGDKPYRAGKVTTRHGTFGYLRIFSFQVEGDVGPFVDDVTEEIKRLPREGLIIDVRTNEGGRTAFAERLLQVISPERPIEPERACFVNTPFTLELCNLQKSNLALGPSGLQPWIQSIDRAVTTGATFSASFPITDSALCNEPRRFRYPGPVIVVIDGLSRSSAEIFAAGFQDHGGKILGVDKMTGGAGANARRHTQLLGLFAKAKKSPFTALPREVDFLIPFRRFQRVKKQSGNEIEDFGVIADFSHSTTRNDVLKDNVDLINEAAKLLVSKGFGAPRARDRSSTPRPRAGKRSSSRRSKTKA